MRRQQQLAAARWLLTPDQPFHAPDPEALQTTDHPGPKCSRLYRLRAAIIFAIGDLIEVVRRMFGQLRVAVTSEFSEYLDWACDDTELWIDMYYVVLVWSCRNWVLQLLCGLACGLLVGLTVWLVILTWG